MGETTNNRVTNQQLYEAVLNIERIRNQQITEMERRLSDKLEPLVAICKQVENNSKEIDNLRTRSDKWDTLIGFFTALVAIIAGILGFR